MSSVRPDFQLEYLKKLLRRLENLLDDMLEDPEHVTPPYIVEQVMEMRGVCATLLQAEIERGSPTDIPF